VAETVEDVTLEKKFCKDRWVVKDLEDTGRTGK